MRPASPSEASEPEAAAEPSLPLTTKTLVDRIDPYRTCTRTRRTVSSHRRTCETEQELTTLPKILAASPEDRDNLIIQKLMQCQKIFDFSDTFLNVKSKEVKRAALNELVGYFSDCHIPKPELIYPVVVNMVAANLFRTLPPRPQSWLFDAEEDEPICELAWPHLQLVYRFFLTFLESSDFQLSTAKKLIDTSFAFNVLRLFDSEDPREREEVKTVVHRIYSKFVALRAFIRKEINNIFLTFVYETGSFNGIAELLEILGSVITGFAVPLKQDHKIFLKRVLMPLHIPASLSLYHTHLAFCIAQFLQKDPSLVPDVFGRLFKFWPRTSTTKEMLFLVEVDELLDYVEPAHVELIIEPLCRQLTRSFSSSNFQINERSLQLFVQSRFISLIGKYSDRLFPILVPVLVRVSKEHWNPATRILMDGALSMMSRVNGALLKDIRAAFDKQKERQNTLVREREEEGRQLEEAAADVTTE